MNSEQSVSVNVICNNTFNIDIELLLSVPSSKLTIIGL